jgi:multiple sugar transport system substrate-binding protein
MKRLLIIVLNLCLIFGFVGCTPKPTEVKVDATAVPAAEEAAATQAPVVAAKELKGEITFATWGSLDEKKVNELIIAEFEKDYPGTKVNLEYIPDGYIQKIETEFMGGTAPDVIYGHPHYFANWASKGLLMDLDPYFEKDYEYFYNKDVFTTSLYDAFMWNGKHVATINGSDTFLLFYNKDMFDKAGVAYPDDTWTWDDFVAAGQKLTILEGDNKQYGFTVSSWPVAAYPFIYSFGGSLFDDMNNPKKVTFDNPNTVAALQFYQDLVYKYQIAPTVQDTQTFGGSFDTGKVAMDITGMWAVVSRKNITDFKWDVANLPLAKGQPRKTIAFYAGYALYKDTKNPDLAWEFAKYMQGDKAQKLLAGMGLITVINHQIASSDEILVGPGMPEHHILRVTSPDYATNGYAFLTNLEELSSKAIQPAYDQLLANTMDAATCAKTIQAEMEKLFAESGKQE